MKPFSLDTVLDFRKQREDIAKNVLFKAMQERKLLVEKLAAKTKEQKKIINSLMLMQNEGAEILEIITFEEKITYTKAQVDELQILLKNKDISIARAQNTLLERSRDRKAMEKLKEKQNAEWKKYLNKKEAAMLDEIAVIHHRKNKSQ